MPSPPSHQCPVPALFTRDCTLSGTSPKGVLRLRLAMKYCRRQHTLEEVVCLVNARTGMDPPYTFRDVRARWVSCVCGCVCLCVCVCVCVCVCMCVRVPV